MGTQADEINALRAKLAGIVSDHSIEARLFASVDFLAVQLAALARLDSAEGERQLEWALTLLRKLVAHHYEMIGLAEKESQLIRQWPKVIRLSRYGEVLNSCG